MGRGRSEVLHRRRSPRRSHHLRHRHRGLLRRRWGFITSHPDDQRPTTYSTPFLGYPQAVYGATPKRGPIVPAHALYRWHIPDPVHFHHDLRVTVQALGWHISTGKYQPLTDDIASVAYWYQSLPSPQLPDLGPLNHRLPR